MIIFALDYMGTTNELQSCIKDGRAMADLARTHCGVTSIIEHYEKRCTPANLEHAFGQISKKMQNDDYLVFFFSGHGAQLAFGMDEDSAAFEDENNPLAFSLFGDDGKVVEYSCSRFAELVANSVNPRARVLMMLDSCHNVSMVDLTNPAWDDIEAVCLRGAEDKEEFEDPKKSGLFSMSAMLAIQSLQKQGEIHYSVGAVFNKMLKEGEKTYPGEPHFWLEHGSAATPSSMAWPLLPTTKYNPMAIRKRQSSKEDGKAKMVADAPRLTYGSSMGKETQCNMPHACSGEGRHRDRNRAA